MKIHIMLIVIFLSNILLVTQANSKTSFYKTVFPNLFKLERTQVPDPINYKPVNTTLLIVKDKSGSTLGYIREIKTNTGCNSACLPIVFTLFYDKHKKYLKIQSKPGLTKLNHDDFTPDDYFQLESILVRNPKVLKSVKHPFDMVDGITRATTKKFKGSVVPTAAFSTLRINTYNQHTLQFLAQLK